MREGDICQAQSDKQSVEARLSSSCPSLVVDSGDEAAAVVDTPDGGRRGRGRGQGQHFKDHRDYRKRSGRQRSPSVSTGESDEEAGGTPVNLAGLETGSGLQTLHKSVSTPSMGENENNAGTANTNHHGKTS